MTLQKRDSENMLSNTPQADDVKSQKVEAAIAAEAAIPTKTPVDQAAACLAAWGAGRFDETAMKEFFTDDFVLDASSAAHSGVAAYKVHSGFGGLKDWFAFVGSFDFEELEFSYAAGQSASEVWVRSSAKKAVYKETGKSAPFDCVNLFEWDGDKALFAKMTVAVYNPATIAAIMSEREPPFPFPPPVQLPAAFDPHLTPMEPFGEIMALWGSGELNNAEALRKHIAAAAVSDLTDVALAVGPLGEVFTAHLDQGEWMDYQAEHWAMSNVDVAPIVGLKPGCVMARVSFDVKHKGTGKEAKGVQVFNELAYNADGQFVYLRHYWINAPLLASIY